MWRMSTTCGSCRCCKSLCGTRGGIKGAARALGVDHRTVTASLAGGELSRRVREALERLLLAGGGSAAARQREEMDALEQRIEGMEKEMRRALRAIEGGSRRSGRSTSRIRGGSSGGWRGWRR